VVAFGRDPAIFVVNSGSVALLFQWRWKK
jgi:hypothetical protein